MKYYHLIIIAVVLSAVSCRRVEVKEKEQTKIEINDSEYMLSATAWQQRSAEYRAMCLQSFNIAKMRIDEITKQYDGDKPAAVVVDIDETMLDNSPFEAECIIQNKTYTPEFWTEWVSMENAIAIPGALSFVKYAQSKNVQVIYISNRKVDELQATLNNLVKLDFPFATADNIHLKDTTSTKQYRRQKASEQYNIVMLIGDNLIDFDEMFEIRKPNFGKNIVDEHQELFGDKFIMLPNPIYGSWVNAITKSNDKVAKMSRIEALKNQLIRF